MPDSIIVGSGNGFLFAVSWLERKFVKKFDKIENFYCYSILISKNMP